MAYKTTMKILDTDGVTELILHPETEMSQIVDFNLDAMESTALPLVAGTPSAGLNNGKFAQEGHVHPEQTTINGKGIVVAESGSTHMTVSATAPASGIWFDTSSMLIKYYNGSAWVSFGAVYQP